MRLPRGGNASPHPGWIGTRCWSAARGLVCDLDRHAWPPLVRQVLGDDMERNQEAPMHDLPQTMRAVAIDRFGGPEVLEVKSLAVPEPGPRDVLIRVAYAGVAEWDVYEREGGFAEMLGEKPTFPYILGSEGAGVVEAVGAEVERFSPGDRVYALKLPRGGFYAEYTAVPEDAVAFVPGTLPMEQAAGLGWIGVTALRGL